MFSESHLSRIQFLVPTFLGLAAGEMVYAGSAVLLAGRSILLEFLFYLSRTEEVPSYIRRVDQEEQ